MTQSEFPNSGSPSTPENSSAEETLSQEHQAFELTPPFNLDEAEQEHQKKLELFPMPDMTIGHEEAMEILAQTSAFSETSGESKSQSQISEDPLAESQMTTDKENVDSDASTDAHNPVRQVSAPNQSEFKPTAAMDTATIGAFDSGSINQQACEPEPLDKQMLLSNSDETAIETPNDHQGAIAIQENNNSEAGGSRDKRRKGAKPKFKILHQWGSGLSSNSFTQNFLGFRGWPWAIALGASGVTTMGAFTWLAGLPPVPSCKNPSPTWTAAARLYCADQAARQKEPQALASALDLVGDWNQDDPLFDQANKLSDNWARSILDVAERELDEGRLNDAVKLAQKVPKASTYYDESQATIKDWQRDWKTGERILEVARDAIQEQDWAIATEQMRQLAQLGGDHWQRRANKLISEMTIEQDAFRQLNMANDRAGYGTIADIESAIKLATTIDAKRLARKKLVAYVDRWSEKLVDLADYYYEIGDYETAIEAAKAVPPGSKVETEAIAYIQASRAQAASEQENTAGYIQAVAYASQVSPSATVRETSVEAIETWETEVQAWAQIEFAKLFTRIDQSAGYNIAIDHAKLIDVDNPKRIEAQSLIAQWDKQRNSVADRQTIARAAQLAQQTDMASVQAAIAEARRVNVASPLRVRAQTLIAEWENSIEEREDLPILEQAKELAEKGDLYAAITAAEKINSDRALYGDAQDAIYGWLSDIQIAEDDPILNDAAALANQGRYTEAIARAAEIQSGRALYYEAQDLIGRWISERARIEAARRPPEPQYQPEPSLPEETYNSSPEEQFNNTPTSAEPYAPVDRYTQEELVDSASGAGLSGGPEDF